MRVLLIAPNCDGTDVGEAWSTHQWASRLAERCELTVLTYNHRSRPRATGQLPGARVVEWRDWPLVGRFERFNSMLKPGYLGFARKARRWIAGALERGERFDLVHQVSPLALRYACPAIGLGVPLVFGPVGGSLDSPESFKAELGTEPWYVRLRALDRWRLEHDAKLRRTYAETDVVIGVAPYVRELLESCGISPRRFEVMSETGVLEMPEAHDRCERSPGELKLLFVGRIVRTKGVRDAVRALARLPDLPGVTLDVVGDGDDLAACEAEADQLGLGARVGFHGRKTRAECDGFYARADAFCFPSMREPSGNVVFESLSHGLPVIASDRGGPGYVVDETCGLKVPVSDPGGYADSLAAAIRRLANEPGLVTRLSAGARARVESVALWERKIDRLCALYDEVSGAGGGSETGHEGRVESAGATA